MMSECIYTRLSWLSMYSHTGIIVFAGATGIDGLSHSPHLFFVSRPQKSRHDFKVNNATIQK